MEKQSQYFFRSPFLTKLQQFEAATAEALHLADDEAVLAAEVKEETEVPLAVPPERSLLQLPVKQVAKVSYVAAMPATSTLCLPSSSASTPKKDMLLAAEVPEVEAVRLKHHNKRSEAGINRRNLLAEQPHADVAALANRYESEAVPAMIESFEQVREQRVDKAVQQAAAQAVTDAAMDAFLERFTQEVRDWKR